MLGHLLASSQNWNDRPVDLLSTVTAGARMYIIVCNQWMSIPFTIFGIILAWQTSALLIQKAMLRMVN